MDGLVVDALIRLGVVLGLHRERAADRRDEKAAVDGDVRVPALDVVLPGGLPPLHVVRRREDVVALATSVQEPGPAVRGEGPAQDADVLGLLPGPEHGQQLAVHPAQLEQLRIPEVAVERGELSDEFRVVEQAGGRIGGERVEIAVVEGQYVGHGPVRTGGGGIVAAEEQEVSDRDDVAGRPVLLGAQAGGAREREPGRSELLDSGLVQRLGAAGELRGLGREPVAQHLVRSGVHCGVHPRVRPGRRLRLRGRTRSHGHLVQLPSFKVMTRSRSRRPLRGGSATSDRTPVSVSSWRCRWQR